MGKRNLVVLVVALVLVFGVIVVSKYIENYNILKQTPEEILLVPQKPIAENFSLPPPPATDTSLGSIDLPKPPSPKQQQDIRQKMNLPPPPAQ